MYEYKNTSFYWHSFLVLSVSFYNCQYLPRDLISLLSPAGTERNPLCEQLAVWTLQLHRRGSHSPDPLTSGIFNTNKKIYTQTGLEYTTFFDVLLRSISVRFRSLFTSFWKSLTWKAGWFAFKRHWNLSQLCWCLSYFDFSIFWSISPGLSEAIFISPALTSEIKSRHSLNGTRFEEDRKVNRSHCFTTALFWKFPYLKNDIFCFDNSWFNSNRHKIQVNRKFFCSDCVWNLSKAKIHQNGGQSANIWATTLILEQCKQRTGEWRRHILGIQE